MVTRMMAEMMRSVLTRNLQDGVEESNDSVVLVKESKMLVSRLVVCVVMRMTIPPNAQMNNPPGTVNGIVGVAAGVKLSEMHAKKPVINVKPKKSFIIKFHPITYTFIFINIKCEWKMKSYS